MKGADLIFFPHFLASIIREDFRHFSDPKIAMYVVPDYLVRSSKKGWDTAGAYTYVLYRLSWNPNEDIRQIAEDFCAIHFGREAAKTMAEIYLKTSVAYKYGLHIEPVSYGRFNSFIHMRVNVFPAMGYPRIDDGREHMEFLHTIYLRCKPWQVETLDDLDHGLETAKEMVANYKNVKSKIADKNLAQELENKLNMTRWLIETNNEYVKTTFDYFAYRENPNESTRQKLSDSYNRLLTTKKNFMNTPGYGYILFGVDQVIKNAGQALENLPKAEQKLAAAPSRDELEKTITKQQNLYKELLEKYKDEIVKLLHIEVKVDGRDLLIVKEGKHRIRKPSLGWGPCSEIKIFYRIAQRRSHRNSTGYTVKTDASVYPGATN